MNIICPSEELITWIKLYLRIRLTYTQRNGGGHFSDLLLMWPSIMLTKYITNSTGILENIEWMLLAFAETLLMRTTSLQKVCCPQRYSQVVTAYITLPTICKFMVSITGLPSAHNDGVAYQNVKEPQ